MTGLDSATSSDPGSLPEAVRPLAWLLGRWSGFGKGQYPTIEDFTFVQEVEFRCDGRPFLSYVSRSWMIDEDGNRIRPTGTETGFWRPQPGNVVEVVLSHPTGYAEIWAGWLTVASASRVPGSSSRPMSWRARRGRRTTRRGSACMASSTGDCCGRSTWRRWVSRCRTIWRQH